jgi:hypothetical protein
MGCTSSAMVAVADDLHTNLAFVNRIFELHLMIVSDSRDGTKVAALPAVAG